MKITITQNTYVVQSSLKTSEIKMLAERNPDALKVKDENGNELFAVSYDANYGVIGRFGVTFNGTTRDDNAYATVTGCIPADIATNEAAKNYVAEQLMSIMPYIELIEEEAPKAVEKINSAKKSIVDSITVSC